MAFTYVTITRDYDLADGVDPAGEVSFTPTSPMTNGPTVVAAPVTRVLDIDGILSIPLAANTDPATTPADTSYLVRELIAGVSRSYYVQIPHDAGATVDLSTLLTAQIPPVVTYPAPGPPGPPGTGTTPGDGTVTDAKVASGAAINADKLADGTTNMVMTAAERTKLAGVAAGATAYTDEQAQDAAAGLLTAGTHSGISFSYVDGSNRVDATVSGGGGSGDSNRAAALALILGG